jgi:hypothetical protein
LGTLILPEDDLKNIKKILKKTGFTDRLTMIRRVKIDEEDTR